jgi:phage-related protein (TIGR01555 family)
MPARKKPTPATPSDSKALDGLENLVTGQGGSSDSRYHGARRFVHRMRTDQELVEMYQANWLAGQVVDIPAFEMTRERREIQLKDTNQAAALLKAEADLCIWERMRECVQWADLFGGGGLLLGIEGTGEFNEPLYPERVKKGSLKWIHAVDAASLIPVSSGQNVQLVIDPTSPEFMQPEFYQVVGAQALQQVHYSRIVKFNGLALPWRQLQATRWWGGSRIGRAYDVIADDEQVTGGVADLITESKIDVYGIKGLMALLSTPGGEERVRKRIAIADTLKSIYKGIIIDSEETYEQKESQLVQGMANIMQAFLMRVAAASGIPVTRLLGTSARGLNATGEGDIRNFYDMIDARRETYLRPRIDQLDKVLIRSVLGTIPDDFTWEFGPLWQMDETEVADVEKKRAETAQVYVNLGVIDPVIVAKQLLQDGTYVGVDDDWIKELEEASKLEPEPPADLTDPNAKPNADPSADPDEDPSGDEP